MARTLRKIQLYVKIGKGKSPPKALPYAIVTALNNVVVNDNIQEQSDGFQIDFILGKQQTKDYDVLQKGLFVPNAKVVIGVFLDTKQYVLISGVITFLQLNSNSSPGASTFSAIGKSITHQLNRKAASATFEHLSDGQIVTQLVGKYTEYGLSLAPPKSMEQPLTAYRIPSKPRSTTDLAYIQELARRNGFVFYSQPQENGDCQLYWGPENRKKVSLPALTMNMGDATNVKELSFAQDSDLPRKVQGTFLDVQNKQNRTVAPEAQEEKLLAETPLQPLDTAQLNDTARYTSSQLANALRAAAITGLRAVSGRGTLDTTRYPYVLEAGKVVEVRGAGYLYDGKYIIKSVKHSLERGKYTQAFELARDGVGAGEQAVRQL